MKEEKHVEEYKSAYENIKVPDAAEEKVRRGIMKAKNENKKKSGVVYRIIRPVGITAAAALALIIVLTNASSSIAYAMERIPVLGSISRVLTFRTYESKEGGFEANMEIPHVESEEAAQQGNADAEEKITRLNKSIEEYAQEFIAMYEADLKASEGEGNYALESSYEVIADNEKYLTIRVDTLLVMASGTQYVKTFTVDKLTGDVISLAQLLGNDADKLTAVSDNIKEQMREQMAADEGVTYFLDSEEPEWDFTGLKGEESFFINDNGQLIILFNEYDVAPGYMGAVQFTIPEEVAGVW